MKKNITRPARNRNTESDSVPRLHVQLVQQFVRRAENVFWEKLSRAQKRMTAVGKRGYDCRHEGRILSRDLIIKGLSQCSLCDIGYTNREFVVWTTGLDKAPEDQELSGSMTNGPRSTRGCLR